MDALGKGPRSEMAEEEDRTVYLLLGFRMEPWQDCLASVYNVI